MKIKDLANLDIKDLQNINAAAILKSIKRRPDILVISVCILLTIIASGMVYRSQKRLLKTMSRELKDLQKKATVFDELTEAQRALADLKAVLPQSMTESKIMEILTHKARKYHILIDTFSPATITEFPSHSILSITLDMIVSDYANLWKFIYSIENLNQTLRIDQLSLETPQKQRAANAKKWRQAPKAHESDTALDENTLKLEMTISVVNFKL